MTPAPAAASATATSQVLQPFGKTKAEQDKEKQDKEHAELLSLRQLHSAVKQQPLGEQPDDVKKALTIVDQTNRKVESKSYKGLVDLLQKARKKLSEIDDQWNAYRVTWAT